MNQRLLWTTVTLVTAVLGIPSVGRTQTAKKVASDSQPSPSPEAVKVGEYQSTAGGLAPDTAIAKIQAHTIAGRQAATLYIRDIPVFTFIGAADVATSDKKIGVISDATSGNTNSGVKVATVGDLPSVARPITSVSEDNLQLSDPVWRAAAVADKINQLSRQKIDASKITVSWKLASAATGATTPNKSTYYAIEVGGEKLIDLNSDTKLAGTTNDPAKDALQAANRLRRLLGNASPLTTIANLPLPEIRLPNLPKLPQLPKEINIGSVRISFNGWASFYGNAENGSATASGDTYNQNALTAAHKTLPFGTKVRVTNTRNGRSVVVRINDRGPYVRGRMIDLSFAAARILGMMDSGTAPVRLDVLNRGAVNAHR
jgi:rare lipoprotein A